MAAFKYKAFISYSHADGALAEWLLKSLEKYKVPKNLVGTKTEQGFIPARLTPIFRDREELPASGAMTERLIEALQLSEFLIVVGSPHAAKSKLVNREIVEFKRIHGEGRTLCMIVDGVPFSNNPETECFPEALLHSFHTDGVKAGLSAEGLAADLRPHADGKSMALMKIIAGILGVGLNDIVKRQERRRQNQLANIAALASLGLFAMGGLTFEAISAREEAVKARHLAESRTQESTQRLADNEELTHFLMTNIYEELLTVGNLDTLEDITTHILDYYEKRDMDALSEKQIFSLTGARLRLGQNLDRRGESQRAEKIFEETLKISRAFYTRMPESNQAVFRLSNNLFFTGYLAYRQGRLDDALKDYQERLELLEASKNINPPFIRADWKPHWQANPTTFWREKIADAEKMIAELLTNSLRDPRAAIEYAQSSVQARETLASLGGDNQETYVNLGSSYQTLGDTLLRLGQLSKSLKAYESRLWIFQQLSDEEPGNYRILRRLLISQANIANISLLIGEAEAAKKIYEETAERFDLLTTKDPENTLWLADSATNYVNLAKSALRVNDLSTFSTAMQQGKKQVTEALARDNSRPSWRLTKYRGSLLEAKFLMKSGQQSLASEKIKHLLSQLNKEEKTFKYLAGSLELHTAALLVQGDLMERSQRTRAARQCWYQVIEAHLSTSGIASLSAKYNLALAYRRLGQREDEYAILEILDQSGYRERSFTY